ncbi:MAG TPA: hypothetical protein DCS21_02895 [Gammaproteobacteria bacterium]|nr:hypothetical protein [Gammaproteobacteria bacterium]
MHFAILPILLLIARPVFAATPLTFEEVDTSGDGLVSIDEVVVINELNFNAADTDQDETLEH